MGLRILIDMFWRCLIVVICLSTLSTQSPSFNESLFGSRLIALTGIYWFLIPVIDEVKKIIK